MKYYGWSHALKTWPGFFAALRDGSKTFEWRVDDREFDVGDWLELREWCPTKEDYTGEVEWRGISYIMRGGKMGVPEGYCILGLALLPTPEGANDGRSPVSAPDAG